MLISVVSPVYNCTGCLEEIVRRVREGLSGTDVEWEIVFVDDCGPGAPWPVIESLAAADPRVRGIRLMRNHGQHLAIWAGLAHARGEWVAVIDCDLQDDPLMIPALYREALNSNADAIIVDRAQWSESGWRRSASRAFYNMLAWATGFRIDGNVGNFGLYSRRMVVNLLQFGDREVFLPAMAVMTGLKRRIYVVPRSQRHEGRSSYNLRSLFRFAIALVVRFSDRPLKISAFAGLALAVISSLVALIVLVAWLAGDIQVAGWASTMLSIYFIGGLLLFTLGIHGFYIGRIFTEVQLRPRIRIVGTTSNLSKNETTI